MIKTPNFFIVGTVKGGTTSMHNYLSQHPHIYMSPIKEPHHFDADIDPQALGTVKKMFLERNRTLYRETGQAYIGYIRDEVEYLELFKGVKEEIAVGEATPYYMISRVAAGKIKKMVPDAKIIIMIRNPVQRAWSHYLMEQRDGSVNMSFADRIRKDLDEYEMARSKGAVLNNYDSYIEVGLYYEQIKRYFDLFKKEDIKILLFEDLKNILPKIKDLFNFLGVDPQFTPNIDRVFNQTRVPRFKGVNLLLAKYGLKHTIIDMLPEVVKEKIKNIYFSGTRPELSDEIRRTLVDFFSEDIKKTSKLINIDLSRWLK